MELANLKNLKSDRLYEIARSNADFREVISFIFNVPVDKVTDEINTYYKVKEGKDGKDHGESKENKESKQNINNEYKDTKGTGAENLMGEKGQRKNTDTMKAAKAEESFNKANDLFVIENFEEALDKYDFAVTNCPNVGKYYLNRAACYLKLNEDVLALEDCKKALVKGVNSAMVYYFETEAYLINNKMDLAKNANATGLSSFPDNEKLLKQKEKLI